MQDTSCFGQVLSKLRKNSCISQEALANNVGVSKQAIQKWESGKAFPDFRNLAAIADYFKVSFDYLLCGVDRREIEELRISSQPIPSYSRHISWEAYYKTLPIEYRECLEEGKDIEQYKDLIDAIDKLPDGSLKAALADDLYGTLEHLPTVEGYPYVEPSDYETIVSESRPIAFDYPKRNDAFLREAIKGAWYGRICGCLLGKPVEGIKRDELYAYLKASGNYPLNRYLVKSDAEKTKDLSLTFPVNERLYADGQMDAMPADDDTNYIVLAYSLIEGFGRDFTPDDVANHWMDAQPKSAYCTAERAAFRNFVNGYCPPESARYQNAFREWIGAQIRGDFYGWINPADPAAAAGYAFRDASISHTKNGIYGEMWVSAMLAAVCGGADIKNALFVGLSHIPGKSRLYEAIQKVISAYESGQTWDAFFEDFHKRWNEYDAYDWCHTIPNAEIVAAALLWGGGDYEKSVCLAVGEGFDTDCNGATVGSVVGAAIGYTKIPDKWKNKFSGKLRTSIITYGEVDVDEMVERTLGMIG